MGTNELSKSNKLMILLKQQQQQQQRQQYELCRALWNGGPRQANCAVAYHHPQAISSQRKQWLNQAVLRSVRSGGNNLLCSYQFGSCALIVTVYLCFKKASSLSLRFPLRQKSRLQLGTKCRRRLRCTRRDHSSTNCESSGSSHCLRGSDSGQGY